MQPSCRSSAAITVEGILSALPAAEKMLRAASRHFCASSSPWTRRSQLEGQPFLGGIQLGAFQGAFHLLDLLDGDEGQKLHALHHIRVIHIPPVLEEVVGRGLLRIQPDGAGLGFAHLFALGIEQQGDGHGGGVLAQLLADQFGAAQHVAPLVVAAELEVAAVFLEKAEEVVALHNHVVEFQEGQALLHPLLVAFGPEHVVHREAGADISDKLHVIEV